jgi:hypothetical protein
VAAATKSKCGRPPFVQGYALWIVVARLVTSFHHRESADLGSRLTSVEQARSGLYPQPHFRQAPNFDRENPDAEKRPKRAAQSYPR